MRAVSILLAAAAVLLAVAPAAKAAGSSATAASGKADLTVTALTLTAAPSIVAIGQQVQLTGTLAPAPGTVTPPLVVTISAQAGAASSFTTLGTAQVQADGSFTFADEPTQTQSTVYKADFAEDDTLGLAAATANCTVPVLSVVTIKAPAKMWKGEPATITGTVKPARPAGTEVTVEVKYGATGTWTTLLTAPLNTKSQFSLPWKPAADGPLSLRATAQADVYGAKGTSASAKATVHIDPYFGKVNKKYAHYLVIDHAQFRLYYYEFGYVVRDFTAVLGKPSTPTPWGHFKVYQKVPHPGGPNGADYLKYDGIIGIHGTDQPSLLNRWPRAFSHGCCRLHNTDIVWVYARCPVGTRVWCN